MRRLLLVPVSLVVIWAAAACGTTADDRAALVGPETVSVETVDALARDATFMQALGGAPADSDSDSVLDGTTARTALTFEIQLAGLRVAADEWDVEVTESDRSEAEQAVEQQLQGEVSSTARSEVIDYVAYQTALARRFADLDPSDRAEMRRLYDLVPSQWDQVCVAMVGAAESDGPDLAAAVTDGQSVEEVAESVSTSELVLDPDESCVPVSSLPSEFLDAFRSATPGQTTGPVTLASGGGTAVYYFRVEEFGRVAFEDAADQLEALAEQYGDASSTSGGPRAYVSTWLNDRVEVNPRYGSEVAIAAGVLPPAAPEVAESTVPPGSDTVGSQTP